MHVLVTRPEPDAAGLAARLEAMGHAVTSVPLMQIRLTGTAPDLEGVQAVAFTSANGVRAFAASTPSREIRVFAVGAATAAEARACGFTDIETAAGSGGAVLALLIASRADPAAGPVLHAGGRHVAGNLARVLAPYGIEVRPEALYEAQAAERLPDSAVRALEGEPRPLDGVLLFSPRSARLFEELTAAAGLYPRLAPLTAWCLSPAVAESLDPALWRRIAISPAPDQTSLLALLPPPDADPRSLGNI